MAWKCWCGSSSQGIEDQRDLFDFAAFPSPLSPWHSWHSVVTATCLAALTPAGFSGFFFFCRYFVEAFCGAGAGCAAEETIGATAKPNWFLWVKQKLGGFILHAALAGKEELLHRHWEKNRWLPLPRTISAHIPYWHICGGFYTVSLIQLLELTHTEQLFYTFAKVTADLFFIPVAMTCN